MSNKPTITVPTQTPFTNQVGINYDAWSTDWYSGASSVPVIKKQIDAILPDFRMVHLYRLCGWTEIISNNALDPVTHTVLTEAVASTNNSKLVEVSLGTSVGMIPLMANGDANGNTGADYCTTWVSALVDFFNDASMLKKTIKCITLGNELDTSTVTDADLGTAMDNLYAALTASPNDFGSIPITISLSNMSLTNKWGTFKNDISNGFMATVISKWQSSWNGGQAFLFANHYPDWIYDPTGGENGLDGYITGVQKYNSNPPASNTHGTYDIDIYIGETGFTAEGGKEADEATYINDLFAWLAAQSSTPGTCIPLFVFEGFNEPKKAVGQQEMGIYKCDKTTGAPSGIKAGISVPTWIK